MDENERKRKRELGIDTEDQDGDSASDDDLDIEKERPGEGLHKTKKQKVDGEDDAAAEAAKRSAKAEKRKEKRQAKKEKVDKLKQKQELKKARKEDQDLSELQLESSNADPTANGADMEEDETEHVAQSGDIDAMDISGLADGDNDTQQSDDSSPSSPDQASSTFDASTTQSAASSSSSIVPPGQTSQPAAATEKADLKPKKEKALKLPEVDAEELQARLRSRIEQLRAKRKADGPVGQGPRSRQELLEARRKKEEARKQHKKELRLQAKQEEERKNNERLQRASGSPMSTDLFSPRPIDENNFSFGRVAFEDGIEADSTLSSLADHKRKKGPQDTRTALLAAEKKAQRLASLDSDKRADIEEKDLWLNAKKKAHGERVRDDQNLLKKALKRKDKIKTKSATEWNERIEGVRKGKEMRDKKRETNLAKRRDEKGSKKGGKKGGSSGGGGKKGRPGFEGRFKQ